MRKRVFAAAACSMESSVTGAQRAQRPHLKVSEAQRLDAVVDADCGDVAADEFALAVAAWG